MALRHTLSLRSLFSARCYKPSYSSIIHREEKKLNYGSFLHQRSFSSSMILSQQHLMRSSSLFSQITPFGVSIYHRSMSTSRFPGSDMKNNYSVLQYLASVTKVLDKVVDAAHQFIDEVHFFTGLNWWVSIVLIYLLLPLVSGLLIVITSWSRNMIYLLIMKTVSILTTVNLDTKSEGGDVTPIATSQKEFDTLVTEYGGEDIIKCSTSARKFVQPWLYPWVGITEKVASFTTGSASFPTVRNPYALSMFPVLPIFQLLAGLECTGILVLVAFTTLGKRVPKARNFARFLAIPVVLVGMVLSKAAQCYFKTCTMFSLASISLLLLLWNRRVRKQYLLNENASNAVPTGSLSLDS